MLAWYLVVVLLLWPLMVAAVKCFDGDSWRSAQKYTWNRWNEIRTTWRFSESFLANSVISPYPIALPEGCSWGQEVGQFIAGQRLNFLGKALFSCWGAGGKP
jgi:hypothetical protein